MRFIKREDASRLGKLVIALAGLALYSAAVGLIVSEFRWVLPTPPPAPAPKREPEVQPYPHARPLSCPHCRRTIWVLDSTRPDGTGQIGLLAPQ